MLLDALFEAAFEVLVRLPFALLKRAWQLDFPDPLLNSEPRQTEPEHP